MGSGDVARCTPSVRFLSGGADSTLQCSQHFRQVSWPVKGPSLSCRWTVWWERLGCPISASEARLKVLMKEVDAKRLDCLVRDKWGEIR